MRDEQKPLLCFLDGAMLMKSRMKLVSFQVLFGLWAPFVAGQTPTSNWTSPKSSSSACTGCAVAAEEVYLSYPYSISTVTTPVTVTVVPYVTPHADGSRETNWRTETQGSNGPTSMDGSLGVQQPKLTWKPYAGVTLTYPTTYVNFPSPYGGLNTVSNGACVTATAPLTLPTNSEQGLIYPVTISNWDTKLPWNVTQQLLDYLDSIPAVSQQFHGTKVGSCEWVTYVTPTTSVLPIQKVTVQYLTARTAQAVIVTPDTKITTPTSTPVASPTAFTRNVPTATATTTPIPSPNTVSAASGSSIVSSPAPSSGGTHLSSSLGVATAIISILLSSSSILLGGSSKTQSLKSPAASTPRTIAVSSSITTHSAVTTVIALPDGSLSTMTMVPGYVSTSMIYSTVTGSGSNGTQVAPTNASVIFTSKAYRVRYGFLGWILGIMSIIVLRD